MNDNTIDPQKDAQATEEMLAMLDALEQDDTAESATEDNSVSSVEVPDDAWQTESSDWDSMEADSDVAEQVQEEGGEDAASGEALDAIQKEGESEASKEDFSTDLDRIESSEESIEAALGVEVEENALESDRAPAKDVDTDWDNTELSENDALDSLLPDDNSEPETVEDDAGLSFEAVTEPCEAAEPTLPDTDIDALPQQALHTLETAAELKEEAEELAAEVAELEQETASAALTATETLQDETEHTQSSVEHTLAAAEQAFNILRERGIAPASTALDGMDPETLMQKLAELEARNQKLRERNEAIKARLAALK